MPKHSNHFEKEPYRYESLETEHGIRLLQIVSKKVHGSTIQWQFSLLNTNTKHAPEYEALSYVWGTPSRKETLELSDGTLLRITKSLNQALPYIAMNCSTGYLWVDQICINQDDLSERAQQVSIMGSIYSNCSRVLVWLGLVQELKSGIAAQCSSLDSFLSVPLDHAPPSYYSTLGVGCRQRADDTIRDIFDCKRKQKELLDLCGDILKSPWFSRAWVFQGVVLPRKSAFILEDSMAPPFNHVTIVLPTLWELCKTAWKLETHNLSMPSGHGVLKEMHDRWAERQKIQKKLPMPLYQTLSTLSAEAKTSSVHDQLYAFFGMNQDDRIRLKPSYEISLQAALVATARSMIEGTKSLDIFKTLLRLSITKTTPSWVPDSTAHRLVVPFLPLHALRSSNAQTEMYSWNGQCDERTLWVHGRVVTTVDVEVEHEISTSEEDLNTAYLSLLPRIINARTTSRVYDPDVPLTVLESILPALLAEGHCGPCTYEPEDTVEFAGSLQTTYWWFAMSRLEDPICLPKSVCVFRLHNVEKRTITEYIRSVMHNRQLYITQDGRLATGSGLQRGDLICILHGCSHPVALRHIPTKDAYEVVSTCYLEDWMDPWNTGAVNWKEDEAQEFALI